MPLFADRSLMFHQILRESQNCTFHGNKEATGRSPFNGSLESETMLCSYGCCEGKCCYPEHLSSIMWISFIILGTAAVLSALIISVFYLCLMKRQNPKSVVVSPPGTGLSDLQHRDLYQNPSYCSGHQYVSSIYVPSTPAGPLPLPPAATYVPVPPANYRQQFVATYQLKAVLDPSRPVLSAYPHHGPLAYPQAPRAVPVLVESSLPPSYTLHEEGDRCAEQIPREAAAPAQVPSDRLHV